ncbi:MAG: HAMP domain-containing sensor histidine kinase [Planctomycetota bacterium]
MTMRQWKIRTKMIAGLGCLALVILLLVYSSWSQLSRDRLLTTEISQLADEITHAIELSRLAASMQSSHAIIMAELELEGPFAGGMLEIPPLEFESHESNAREYEYHALERAEESFVTRMSLYREAIYQHSEQDQSVSLFIDREEQEADLHAIDQAFAACHEMCRNDFLLRNEIRSTEDYHRRLSHHLDALVSHTRDHFDSIQDGMKAFHQNVRAEQRSKRSRFYTYTSAAAFLIAFLFWSFWTVIVVPFRTLFRGSQLIASGHHHHKIELGTDDEIGLMAETVNDITDRFNRAVADVTRAKLHAEQEVRDRTRELIRNEQLASVGFLAAGVAHEINNPLGVIAWTAEALESTLEDLPESTRARIEPKLHAELAESLAQIQSEAFRCKGITRRLLDFSRLGDSSRAPEDLGAMVESVAAMVSKVGEYRCKTLNTHCDPGVIAHCNAQEIQQVVLNLVSNALESVDTDGHVDVFVHNQMDPHGEEDQAVVIVQDDGCGMTREVIEHLFEPFFTRRRDDTGTGLGLSISSRIVSLHHGSLTPHSNGEGCGSRFVLRLPCKPAQQEQLTTPAIAGSINLDESELDWNHASEAA